MAWLPQSGFAQVRQNVPVPNVEESATGGMQDYRTAKLRALDKITGRTQTFQMDVGKTRQFGDIYIRLQACREPPPIEEPESAAFLQIWETTPQQESQWVFSGWMFASSPALSSMDHAIYDVLLLDCLDKIGVADSPEGSADTDEDAGDRQETGTGKAPEADAQQESDAAVGPDAGEDMEQNQ